MGIRQKAKSTLTEYRTVVRDGKSHQVPIEVPAPEAPRAPRDWDAVILGGVLVVAAVLTVVTIAWSTVSIGGLLGGGWAAYGGAAVFDTSWLAVIGLSWLARYEPTRRERLEKTSRTLLVLSMAAIVAHSVIGSTGTVGAWVIGAFGAAIALGSKILWAAAIGSLTRDLDPETAAWVAAEQSEAHAQLATARVKRRAEKSRALAAAHRLAIEQRYGLPATHRAEQIERQEVPDVDVAEVEAAAPERQALAAAVQRKQAAGDDPAARQALEEALQRYMAAPPEPTPELDAAYADAQRMLTGWTGQPAPGSHADRRPEKAPEQVSGPAKAGTARPDTSERAEEYRVPPQAPASLAAGVRELRAARVEDPAVMSARLSALMGRDVPLDSVKREIRRAKSAEQKAAKKQAAEITAERGTEGYV